MTADAHIESLIATRASEVSESLDFLHGLELVYERVRMGIVMVTQDNRFWHANPYAERALKRTRADLRELDFIDLVCDEDRPRTRAAYEAAKVAYDQGADAHPIPFFVNRYDCPDGTKAKLQWLALDGEVAPGDVHVAVFFLLGYE